MKENEKSSFFEMFSGILLIVLIFFGFGAMGEYALKQLCKNVFIVVYSLFFCTVPLQLKWSFKEFEEFFLMEKFWLLFLIVVGSPFVGAMFIGGLINGVIYFVYKVYVYIIGAERGIVQTVIATLIIIVFSVIAYVIRKRYRFIYGVIEVAAGILLVYHKIQGGINNNSTWGFDFYFALLSAGIFLIIRGLESISVGKELDPLFIGACNMYEKRLSFLSEKRS
jgi:bacteriorhodopsin